jgi:hypothetical protein
MFRSHNWAFTKIVTITAVVDNEQIKRNQQKTPNNVPDQEETNEFLNYSD